MQDLIGHTLGHYRFVEKIGEGGMGEVYRAHDERLDRDVAIKVLPEEVAQDTDRLARFEREAKAVAKLSHPNILDVYELGDHRGRPFMATELLEGETLRERIEGGSLGWRKAAEIGAAIADGLGAAHEAGIVHRDLKPSNVFLTKDGRVKVLDFGLARFEAEGADKSVTHAPTITRQTDPGTVLGTVGYMSPEQVRGETVDQRSDIFSLGCVLYEMVSGQRAFSGDTAVETMSAILKEEPSDVSTSGVDVPPELGGTIRRCLEKRPQSRFQSASDLAYNLRTISSASVPSAARKATPPGVRWKGAAWVAVAGAAVVVIALALSAMLRQSRPDENRTTVIGASLEWVAVSALENRTGDPTLDVLGQRAVDLIIQRFSEVGRVDGVLTMGAVPYPPGGTVEVQKLTQQDDAVRSVGPKGPHVLVSGSYYLDADDLEFQARLTDYDSGELLYAFPPIKAVRSDVVNAMEDLRERVVAAVQFHWSREQDLRICNPPRSYEAFLEYERGFRAFGSDYDEAVAAFNKALELDPDFNYVRFSLMVAYFNLGQREQAAEELPALAARQHGFTVFERTAFDWISAKLKGQRHEAITCLREMVRIAPRIPSFRFQLALENLQGNRPGETVKILGPILPVFEAESRPSAWWPLNLVINAHHALGEFEEALEWADVGIDMFPDVGAFYTHKASALAAEGRIEAVHAVIEQCTRMQLRESSDNLGDVMVTVATELRAHGHLGESGLLAAEAADWYQQRASGFDLEDWDDNELRSYSYALRVAGRWDDAGALLGEIDGSGRRQIGVTGALGVVAARTGDHEQARRIFNDISKPATAADAPTQLYWRASIAAHLGEKERAIELLKEAYANGLRHRVWYHIDVDLQPLWDYPPFQELIEPKG